MRYLAIALSMLLCPLISAHAQISVGIGFPGVNIGINVSAYPDLVLVPGYPVYYAPRASSNYFFYDGLYWAYEDDNWYASTWYNGPWQLIEPEDVPLPLLWVPVRYYRRPPVYFRGWGVDAPPHWGEHWGRDWEKRRSGWDRWDRHSARPAAPLPDYQRRYSGDRYPRAVEQQRSIQSESYRYHPREAVAQRQFQAQLRTDRSHSGAQPQAPAEQRSSPPQQRLLQDHQRLPPQPRPPPAQSAQPVQPRHEPSQTQRPPTRPQDRGQGSLAPPQDQARERRPAPQEKRPESGPGPRERSRDNKEAERGPSPR
ncbi:MAG TPA: hypothetical protein VI653_19270 [Steroidobacteraceae bacterium]